MHTFKIHDSIVLAPTYIVVAYCNLYLIVTREKKIIIITNVYCGGGAHICPHNASKNMKMNFRQILFAQTLKSGNTISMFQSNYRILCLDKYG